MHFRDLPGSKVLGRSRHPNKVAALLKVAVDNRVPFSHFEIIRGLPHSCRILLVAPISGAVEFPKPLSAEEVATEMFTLSAAATPNEARYFPRQQLSANKGWQVRTCLIRNEPAALLLAEWIFCNGDE